MQTKFNPFIPNVFTNRSSAILLCCLFLFGLSLTSCDTRPNKEPNANSQRAQFCVGWKKLDSIYNETNRLISFNQAAYNEAVEKGNQEKALAHKFGMVKAESDLQLIQSLFPKFNRTK